jgi:hypothetical protein
VVAEVREQKSLQDWEGERQEKKSGNTTPQGCVQRTSANRRRAVRQAFTPQSTHTHTHIAKKS